MAAVQPSSYDQYTNDVLSGKTGSDLATDFWKALSDPNTTTTEKSAMLNVLSGQIDGTMDNKTAAAELIAAEAAGNPATTPAATDQPSSYVQFRNDVASGKTGDDLAPDFWKALSDPDTTTTEKSAMLDVLYGQTHHTMDNKTAVAELDKAGLESSESSIQEAEITAWMDSMFGPGPHP
jgi:hypothetical protein